MPRVDRDSDELVLLRHMAGQPPRLRHVTVEWLAQALDATTEEALAIMGRLDSDGLVMCHRDADDGCICCASPTERGLAVATSIAAPGRLQSV